ncbi:MAG TPA: ABC transporter permease, partial [Bryobacteraceae bacterium]|nr:ABC transporter permease [Bryobacteraceae bacterium]
MDLRFALRYLRRNPGFSIGAIVVLALGMGANTAIFSIINAVLIRPLDYPNADRIVAIEPLYKRSGKTGATASAPDFHDLRKQNTTLEAMAYYVGGEASSVVNGQAIYASSWYVTPEFFKVFALPASFGRLLGQHEDKGSVVVVSHAWAQRHFADPRRALGQSLKVRGQIVEVVGVAAPGFHYPAKADIWMPGGLLEENSHRTAHNYIVVGRLKPHVQLATAAEDLRVIADRLERQYSENRDKSVAVTPLQNQLTNSVQSTLWVLLGAVGLVLLIACANVANLLVARAGARTREIALRSAVGASRLRLVRQLVTESLLLALFGSAAGILLAVFALDALLFLAPANVPRLEEVSLDWTVLIFSVALAFVCSLLFGLAPALQASRVDLTTALRAGGGKGVVGGGGRTTRSVLVVAEVALSVILLVGAGLLLRSYHALSNVDLGFATERIIVTHLSTSASTEEAARRVTQFYRRLIENVGAVPGIASIAGVFSTPLGDTRSNAAYFIQGRPEGRPGEYPFANMQVVTPRYFETMGVRILQGRDFTNADEAGRHQVVIVNEAFVRQAFPSGRTLGQRVRSGFTQQSAEWMEIIGVVRDVRARNPGVPAGPEMYLPYLQHPGPG